MGNSAIKIIQEIESEKGRRSSLTRRDLEQAYNDLENDKFADSKLIRFIADLSESDEIAYHYELICRDWESYEKLYFERGYEKHGSKGIEFLFEQIDKAGDEKTRVNTVYLIAEILSKLSHRNFYPTFCSRLVIVIISLLEINNSALRQKLIIALGWTASSEEIDLLVNQMLFDEDALCRAWSAAGLMQMSFHRVRQEEIREKAGAAFAKAIKEESDINACGIMIEAVQTIFGKKWISLTAVENNDVERIEKAKKSALRFLTKFIDTGR